MGTTAADSAQFHILAVDDNTIDRKLIERLLKISSFKVTSVESGTKALEFLGLQNQVNLVITDYCMPEMTGFDLLKKIKESSYLRDIPVVIMSSENVPSRVKRCLEEGAEEFLLKPVRLSDVKKLKPHIMKSKNSSQQYFRRQIPATDGGDDLRPNFKRKRNNNPPIDDAHSPSSDRNKRARIITVVTN